MEDILKLNVCFSLQDADSPFRKWQVKIIVVDQGAFADEFIFNAEGDILPYSDTRPLVGRKASFDETSELFDTVQSAKQWVCSKVEKIREAYIEHCNPEDYMLEIDPNGTTYTHKKVV